MANGIVFRGLPFKVAITRNQARQKISLAYDLVYELTTPKGYEIVTGEDFELLRQEITARATPGQPTGEDFNIYQPIATVVSLEFKECVVVRYHI